MLKLKELEDILKEGFFDFPNYIEMHGGPHDFVLYEEGSRGHVHRNVKGWIKRGHRNYVFTPWCYDCVSEKPETTVEHLVIRRRGKKIDYSLKFQREMGQAWYWSSEKIFDGRIESLEDLKRVLKQIGIKDNE